MKDIMAIIFAYQRNEGLTDLTLKRSLASVPFGGRYRMIDFSLSNLVNSGVSEVGVITQHNYHSLMDHLGSGKEWDLSRKRDGLFILPPFISGQSSPSMLYRGKLDALSAAMAFIRRSSSKYVILTESDTVCNMSFDGALQFHQEKQADITAVYCKCNMDDENYTQNSYLSVDEDGRVNDIVIKPRLHRYDKRLMEMYIIKRELIEYLVMEAMALNLSNFRRDILQSKHSELKVYGYEFKGFNAKINSVKALFDANMRILDSDTRQELFSQRRPIYTKIRDEVPTYYGPTSNVKNSCLVDGCIIEGEIENCILSRGVKIGKGAIVKNSIIMQGTEVMDGAFVANVIADKDCIIHEGKTLVGCQSYPVVLRKNSVV
jgi:glucose-1-phosphate adenylyltransferase